MKDLEAAYPDLGRSALSRVGLTLRGAGENTLGSLAEAAGWLLTPSEDGPELPGPTDRRLGRPETAGTGGQRDAQPGGQAAGKEQRRSDGG